MWFPRFLILAAEYYEQLFLSATKKQKVLIEGIWINLLKGIPIMSDMDY